MKLPKSSREIRSKTLPGVRAGQFYLVTVMKRMLVFLSLTFSFASLAQDAGDAARLLTVLRQLNVHAVPAELPPAPIPGFVEIVRGLQVLYVSMDGKLLINGDILSVDGETNLTERRRGAIRNELIAAIPAKQRIVVPAQGAVRSRIVVFVDTDCPYCLRLHGQQQQFARRGVEIQYLFYPRSGPSSDSFAQAVSVWCAEDRLAALDDALAGRRLPPSDCPNPVMRHYETARSLQLEGTPAIIGADGQVRYGALSVDQALNAR